jgi:hypothetical protein
METARTRQDAVVNRVPEEFETQKYDEFGLIMTPTQHDELQGNLAESRKARDEANQKLSANQSKLDSAYKTQQQMLADQKAQIEAEASGAYINAGNINISGPAMETVRVVSGSNVEASYMLPRSVIDQLNTQSFNQGDGSYVANWVDGGKFYNVDVTPQGTSDSYGQELHSMLSGAQSSVQQKIDEQIAAARAHEQQKADLYNQSIDAQLAGGLGQLGAAGAALDAEMNNYRANIADQRAAIKAAAAAEQAELQRARERFEQDFAKARGTALNIGFKGGQR